MSGKIMKREGEEDDAEKAQRAGEEAQRWGRRGGAQDIALRALALSMWPPFWCLVAVVAVALQRVALLFGGGGGGGGGARGGAGGGGAGVFRTEGG